MPGYYERVYPVERVVGGNATNQLGYNAAVVGPHAATQRWLYTVPSGVAAHIEAIAIEDTRDAVAPAAVAQYAGVLCNGAVWLPLLYTFGPAVGDTNRWIMAPYGYARPGDTFSAVTFDGTGGGSRTYNLAIRYREFAV